jgi:magnesium-transporting ATPase (P-type)
MAIAFVASTVGMIAMLNYAGQPLPLLLLYFTVMYMFVLVAARVRAEVGAPVVWNHPYGFDQTMPVHWLGTKNIMHMAGPQGTVLFYAMFYIGRTVFAHTTAQAFTDGLRLADHGHVNRRSINMMMILICVVALALTFWFHLDVGYRYGQGLIGAKVGRAGTGWGMSWSKGNYSMLETAFNKPSGPDFTRIAFYVAGFLFTGAVTLARTRLTSFPFHPLGFVMATLYGDWSPYWWPFLIAWLAQRLTLRYGSLPAYRKLVPLFLGLTLGHMIVGGVIWRIIINYFIDPTISVRYYVNLGG